MKPAKCEVERLYLLRIWQDEGETTWHASLKPVAAQRGRARYFHSLESLVRFIKGLASRKP
jgi:hypothetical protein